MRNFLKAISTLVLIVTGMLLVCFFLLYYLPGDPVDTLIGQRATPETVRLLKAELGLNQPLFIRFLTYAKNCLSGNLGQSFTTHLPVTQSILERLPTTLTLSFLAISISIFFGLLFGVLAAINRFHFLERILLFLSTMGIAIPVFWSGLVLLFVISRLNPNIIKIFGTSHQLHMILAAITLGIRPACLMTRVVWSHLINALEQDFIVAARSRGVSELKLVFKYALNSIKIPIITLTTIDLGSFLTGAAITESIFALPGIGKFALDGIFRRDHPVIMGTVLFSALIFILINWLIDFLYPLLDPRIKKPNEI